MITIVNPWGISASYEAQRTDLWTLGLKPVADLVQNPVGVDTSGEYQTYQQQALTGNDADQYVKKVTLPESIISVIEVISGTQKLATPGYDEPLSPMRVEFFHEVIDPQGDLVSSQIYNLLRCWWLLGMAGQQRYNRVILPLLTGSSVPSYKVDLDLTFHIGSVVQGEALADGAVYHLLDCWVSDLQLLDYDYANRGEPAAIVATLQVGAIIPQAS